MNSLQILFVQKVHLNSSWLADYVQLLESHQDKKVHQNSSRALHGHENSVIKKEKTTCHLPTISMTPNVIVMCAKQAYVA